MKRLASFLMVAILTLGLGLGAFAADAPDMSVLEGITVGFSQCDNANSWRVAETTSMQEVAAKYGINCIITDAGGDIAKQASDIQDLITQGVDFLVIAPQQEDGLQAAIADAMDKNIPVILVDRTINGEAGVDYTAEIMSDFVWEAEQAAKVILDVTGGEGNIVIIQGTQGATSTIDRQTGFMNAIEGSNLKVVVDQVGEYVITGGQEVMESVLQAWGDDIAAVYCHNDDMALGAIAAIKQAGFDPAKFNVVGIDSPKAALEAIVAGELLASVSCSPLFGEAAYSLIAKVKAGLPYDVKNQNMDTLYTKDNVDVSMGF